MEAANLLNFHPLGCSKSKHGGFKKSYFPEMVYRITHYQNFKKRQSTLTKKSYLCKNFRRCYIL